LARGSVCKNGRRKEFEKECGADRQSEGTIVPFLRSKERKDGEKEKTSGTREKRGGGGKMDSLPRFDAGHPARSSRKGGKKTFRVIRSGGHACANRDQDCAPADWEKKWAG